MTRKTDWTELFRLCLVDLRNGETALKERLPPVAEKVSDDPLRETFRNVEGPAISAETALGNILKSLKLDTGGEANIWMRGILDDMVRDTRTIEPGETLDTALIGALRKALAAAIVSYDSAIAVAGRLEKTEAAEALTEIRGDKQNHDSALAGVMRRLAG